MAHRPRPPNSKSSRSYIGVILGFYWDMGIKTEATSEGWSFYVEIACSLHPASAYSTNCIYAVVNLKPRTDWRLMDLTCVGNQLLLAPSHGYPALEPEAFISRRRYGTIQRIFRQNLKCEHLNAAKVQSPTYILHKVPTPISAFCPMKLVCLET